MDEMARENEYLKCSMTLYTPIQTSGGIHQGTSKGGPSVTDSKLKIAKPSDFTGGTEKGTLNINTFLLQCDLYLSSYPTATDIQKNTFVLSYCKGSAA